MTTTGNINKNTVPKVCHPQCDEAEAEARRDTGSSAEKCAQGSSFKSAFTQCKTCTSKNGADQSMLSRFYIEPIYGPLLDFCQQEVSSSPMTTTTRPSRIPPSMRTFTTTTITVSRNGPSSGIMTTTIRTGERTITVIVQPTQSMWTEVSSDVSAETSTTPTSLIPETSTLRSPPAIDDPTSSHSNRSLFLVLVTLIPTLTIIILAAYLAYFFRKRKLEEKTPGGDCQVLKKAELHSSVIIGYTPSARELNGRSLSPRELDRNELPLEIGVVEDGRKSNATATQEEQEVDADGPWGELASDFWESPIIPEGYL
ncbi:hypothetical protein QBC38DRAFT_489004 [Podospora fimiseda]|uniref:Uncharacterized protein n=1 Tax=Podospora fimiseda TaxID=252190 RepID=A0AAN6YP25_9PEZI|nr:hypothetical protein QBC38DRAFT_489004 [Podospora fimiseda]